jgi:uncharacterized protein DUF6491
LLAIAIEYFSRVEIMLYKQLLIIAFSSVLLSCASTREGPDGEGSEATGSRSDCIFQSSIRGYTVLDESNLIVEASGRRNYHVVLLRRAFGLSSSWGIRFKSPTGRICSSFSEVMFDGHMANESIRIESIRELTPEDHEYLLIQFGKMEPEIEQTPAPREVKGAEVEELDPAANDD